MKNLNCPICTEVVYSSVGNGCKMCGMPVDKGNLFCSNECKIKYFIVNRKGVKNGKQ